MRVFTWYYQGILKKLKWQGQVIVNKPVISLIYTVAHTWPLCFAQILVDGMNPRESNFQKNSPIYL